MNRHGENISYEEILKKKKKLLEMIFQIAMKQQEYLDGDDVETLIKAIEERQKIISEIESLDSYAKQIDKKDAQSESVKALAGETKKILQEIAEADKKNIKAAEEKVEDYRGQIRSLKNNKKRIVSYQNIQDNVDGIYFDKKK